MSKEDHPWDTEGGGEHFCNLKAEHYCTGNQSERKTAPSGQKKEHGAVLFINILSEFQFTLSFFGTKKSSEL